MSILSLNQDCFNEIFDFLSHLDLISVGQTCKHLKRTAGEFFYVKCVAKTARGDSDGIYILSQQSNIFSEYIQKLSISGDQLKAYQFVGANCTTSIRHFRVCGVLPDDGFEYIKKILNVVEVLELNECAVNGEFHASCLKYCPNVKSLSVTRSSQTHDKSVIIGTDNRWLYRKYKSIENLELIEIHKMNENELELFFQRNPNIRSFSTDTKSLWDNRQTFIKTGITLETLAVDIFQTITFDHNNDPLSMVDYIYYLLDELYKQGSYKHLHLYMVFLNQMFVQQFFSLNAIEVLNGDIVHIDRPLPELNSLSIWCGDEIWNVDQLFV